MKSLLSIIRSRATLVNSFSVFWLCLASALHADSPAWWSQRGATASGAIADDYAAANIGQVKHFATKAAAELNATLPEGAGTAVNTLVASWSQPPAAGVPRDDFAAITIGQLKTVAKPFHDRLIFLGYATTYPWTPSTADDVDTAVANLGQLKMVFKFDFSISSDQLPEWWQRYYFEGQIGVNPAADPDADGYSNVEEYFFGMHSHPIGEG